MNEESRQLRLLILLLASHFVVDAVATVINPLWPTLQSQTASSDREFYWMFLSWNIATSFSQIFFGILGDRYRGTWFIWAGPAAAIVCFSLLGTTHSLRTLSLLVAIAGLGIAAYHPEAASLAGRCLPEQRSRALSLFQFGGFLGQTAGPFYSGIVVRHGGVGALGPALIWMLGLVGLLSIFMKKETQPTQATSNREQTN
ncbi:MAG: MFS transporter, partial [Planctomycetes bacterium]|nr:MFS transporter [Planctomycetota bacterium]